MQVDNKHIVINDMLVHRLISSQFPQWAALSIQPVVPGGWDNRTFRLGEHMLVRLPSAAGYATQVEKEHRWLPILAPLLPLSIPVPLVIGEPAAGYPWKWSIGRWLEGDTAASAHIADLCDCATRLARFLIALQSIDSENGPRPGAHSCYRGGALAIYDLETRQAIAALKGQIDVDIATEVWETALMSTWHDPPVWVHGDISGGNLLMQAGQLSAIIDFGQLTVGDPACDLAIAWTLFTGESREIFRGMLALNPETWARARAWTLWKAVIIAAGLTKSNTVEVAQPWRIIGEVLADHKYKA